VLPILLPDTSAQPSNITAITVPGEGRLYYKVQGRTLDSIICDFNMRPFKPALDYFMFIIACTSAVDECGSSVGGRPSNASSTRWAHDRHASALVPPLGRQVMFMQTPL
jgi:hypothetical protein